MSDDYSTELANLHQQHTELKELAEKLKYMWDIIKLNKQLTLWKTAAIFFAIPCVCLFIVLLITLMLAIVKSL